MAGLSPYTEYRSFETQNFEITYAEGTFAFAEKAAVHLEHAHAVLSPIFQWKPRGKIHVLVADNEDSANGFAAPALRVGIVLIATPPDAWYSTAYTDDWIKLLAWHEYVHVLNIDPTEGWMEGMRILFGDAIRPNGLWPTWMLEGLAVYFETRTSTRGRGRSPYYDGVIRALIEEGKLDSSAKGALLLDRMNSGYPGFPGGEIPYLFGYEMFQQMAKSAGNLNKADASMGELSIRSASRFPYFINGNQENVTGKTWDQLWDDWVKDSHARLQPQLDQIRQQGETRFQAQTQSDFGATGATVSDDGEWLAFTQALTTRRTGLYLRNLKSGGERRLSDKIQGVGLDFSKDGRHLVYSTLNQYQTFQFFSDLWVVDLKTEKHRALSEGLRAKDPHLSPDQNRVVFLKVQNSTLELWIAEINWRHPEGVQLVNPRVLYRPRLFSILGTPKFLDDQTVVFSEQLVGDRGASIRQIQISSQQVKTLLNDGHINRSIAVGELTPGVRSLVFVSDRSGIDNLYRLDLENLKPIVLSNVTTGVLLPEIDSQHRVWVSRLSAQGYQIGTLDLSSATQSVLTVEPNAPDPLPAALEAPKLLGVNESQTQKYSAWKSLIPRQWAPAFFLSYSSLNGLEIDGMLAGFDSTGKHQYLGLLGYQFQSKKIDPYLSYTYYGFRPLITLSATSDTLDYGLIGSDRTYLRSTEARISFSYPIQGTFDRLIPTLYLGREWNGEYSVDSDQRLESEDLDFNRPQITTLGAQLTYRDIEQSRFGFMPERGRELTFGAENRIYDSELNQWKALAAYRHFYSIGDHSVLSPRVRWLGSSRTMSGVDRFYALGRGKRSSDISDRGTGTSLTALGMRGYLLDRQFRNRWIGVASVDAFFALAQIFRGMGTLPFFLEQSHVFVFADGAYLNNVFRGEQWLPSFGGGLSLDSLVLLRLPIRFNVEYQQGTRTDLGGEQNIFVSLQSDGVF